MIDLLKCDGTGGFFYNIFFKAEIIRLTEKKLIYLQKCITLNLYPKSVELCYATRKSVGGRWFWHTMLLIRLHNSGVPQEIYSGKLDENLS
jgi:hypothetical protein